MNTHHPDTTLTNDTITNELDTEKTFMAEKAVNLDVIEFIGDIGSQDQFTQDMLSHSGPLFTEDIGHEASSLAMTLTVLLDQHLDSLNDSVTQETLIQDQTEDPSSGQMNPADPTNFPENSTFLSQEAPINFEIIGNQLRNPFVPTPIKKSNKDTMNIIEKSDKFEACTVCNLKYRSVDSLQEHIVTNHCGPSQEMMKILHSMQQQLNSVLA